MRIRLLPFVALLLLVSTSVTQQTEPAPSDLTPTIRANSRLVVVDAIVTDKAGNPVTDLKPDEITVEENGKAQKIASVELVTPNAQPPEELPPTIYSNRPQYTMPKAGYTILLIDALNTPVENQMWARQVLVEWAGTQLQAGQRVAVYALGNSLYRLQTFTDDPLLLRQAIEATTKMQFAGNKTPQQTGTRVPLPGSTSASASGGAVQTNPTIRAVATRLASWETEQSAYNTTMSISTTTAALRALARMLLGVPGRKNLVWITGGVPISLRMEDMTVSNALPQKTIDTIDAPPPLQQEMSQAAYSQDVKISAANDVKEAASLLQQAQISIYTVDARGLFGSTPQTTASNSGLNSSGVLVQGAEYGTSVSNSGARISDSQANMKTIAGETGGKYFVNRNDIESAVSAASRDGGTYYSIAYYPEKKKFDGSFRKIKVTVKRPAMNVRHRTGYYAVDFSKMGKKERENELTSAVRASSFAPSTELLFDAQIKPPAEITGQMTVPVTFLLRPGNFTAVDDKGGKKIDLDFFVTAMGPDGKSAANTGMTVATTLPPQQYEQISKQGILLPIDIKLPPGNYTVLLAVRDNPTGMVGTLNIPLTLQAPAK